MNFNEAMLIVPPGHSDTNLLIRSIPDWVTDNELEQEMSMYGTLESKKVMRDIETGKSLEKAFVRFSEHAAACDAFRTIMQEGLFGVHPTVEWARQQHDQTLSAAERAQWKKLFMRNIPANVTEAEVRAAAEAFGPVESVTLRWDTHQPRTAGPHGQAETGVVPANQYLIAFIVYSEEGCAATACDRLYHSFPFPSCGETPVLTKLAEPKSKRQGRRAPMPRRERHIPIPTEESKPPAHPAAQNMYQDVRRSSDCYGDGSTLGSSCSSFGVGWNSTTSYEPHWNGVPSSGGYTMGPTSYPTSYPASNSRTPIPPQPVATTDMSSSAICRKWSRSGSTVSENEIVTGTSSVTSRQTNRSGVYRHNPYAVPMVN